MRDRYRVETSRLGHWQIARQYGWRVLADPGADVPDARGPTPRRGVKRLFEVDASEAPIESEADESAEAPEAWEEAWQADESDEAEAEAEDEDEDEDEEAALEVDEDFDAATFESPADREDEALGARAPTWRSRRPPWRMQPAAEIVGLDELAYEGGEAFDPVPRAETEDVAQEQFGFGSGLGAVPPPKVGFEFDVHFGFTKEVVEGTLSPVWTPYTMPALGDVVSTHTEAKDGFKITADGRRIEIATKPFEVSKAGRSEMEEVITRVMAVADNLSEGHRTSTDTGKVVPGVNGRPRAFTLPYLWPERIPISRLPVGVTKRRGGRLVRELEFESDESVWASPQATINVRLRNVPEADPQDLRQRE